MRNCFTLLRFICFLHCLVFFSPTAEATTKLATLDEILDSKQDLWGLASMQQSNGPTFNFFKDLLPPLRYVNAEFHYYPIVLSAPSAASKARLTSNGSGINARAGLRTWQEIGTPIYFSVGEKAEAFGHDLKRLTGPTYERGYLPVVHLEYEQEDALYAQEAFAVTDPVLAPHGVIAIHFKLQRGKQGEVHARIDSKQPLTFTPGSICTTNGNVLAWFDKAWSWNSTNQTLTALLSSSRNHGSASLAIATTPFPLTNTIPLNFTRAKKECLATWQSLLDAGTQLEVPEPYVNDAWRSTVCGMFILKNGDAMNYSAGNAYARLYEAECGDALRGLALFGAKEILPMQSRLLDYSIDTLHFHNAGFKLQALAHLYWLSHDTNHITQFRAKWEKEVKLIVDGREKVSGLFPKERYCGDIAKPVYALNPNANCCRGLRDLAAVLEDVGETNRARELRAVAADFRAAILKAVEKSEYLETKPTFIPMMLFGEEKPYEKLTDTMLGSYYNLLSPYVIASGVFGPRAERERWMIEYLHEHSGVAMGMIRFDQHSGLFANSDGVDDLYGIRYTTKLLELDDVDRALVSFYGKLAQGFTRDTFISAEGTGFRPLDEFGRPMYLPPNASASTFFLWTLRNLLVQDWDLDDDGKPETLRLGFATPRDWLADGKTIRIEKAPTAFGPVSYTMRSFLKRGEVIVKTVLPQTMAAKKILVRARVPAGWKVVSAKTTDGILPVDDLGTVVISNLKDVVEIRFQMKKQP